MRVTPFYRRLDFKLILGLVLSLIVVGIPFFLYFYDYHKQQLIDGLKVSTTNLSKMVVGTLETAMLNEKPHLLNDAVKKLAGQVGVERIMILNKNGELKVSSEPELIGKIFDKQEDPICVVCHKFEPVARNNTTIVKDKDGEEVFRNMNPIYNLPSCYGCHDSKDKINGVLIMDLSMADMRQQLAASNKNIFGMAFIMVLITSVILGLMVNKLILRRIKIFTDTTLHFSKGNLDEVIEFKGTDEISILAKSFNNMTASLKDTLSEVERQKNYLENILNGIDDEIVVVDREFKIITANEAYLNNCLSNRTEIIGAKCCTVLQNTGMSCETMLKEGCLARITFERGTLQKTIYTFLERNGKERYMEMYCSPLKNEDGEIFQVIELRRDITERKFLEAQLMHTEKLTSIGRLAASVAHEINNPLDGIQNCVNIIQNDPLNRSKVDTMLNMISEGMERIGLIVRRLLVYTTQQNLNMEMIDLNKVLEQSLQFVRYKIENQGIELSLALDEDLPEVSGDPYNLSQVFINIFINASDALDNKDDAHIWIESGIHVENSKSYAQVVISDNGDGILDEDLERIFSPFFTTKDIEKGTGLGLSISKNIIEEHGGKITVNNTSKHGTSFIVDLPI